MRRLRHTVAALALLLSASGALPGCGSEKGSTAAHRGDAAKETATAANPTSSTTSSSTSSSPGLVTTTTTATSTRTSSAPAFTQPESPRPPGRALAAAVAAVQRQGYTPDDVSEYHPQQTLRVLTATKTEPSEGHDQRAFFFVDERFIGTDASQPSASLKVLSEGETKLTLGYGLYRSGDSLCCPSGEASVRFQLNDGRLQALDPIPPVHSTNGPARL